MSMSRVDLIEYLCAQQHAARLLSLAQAGTSEGCPVSSLPSPEKRAARESLAAVLSELEDLGLLVSSRVPV